MAKRAIATRPGLATKMVNETAAQKARRETEAADHAAGAPARLALDQLLKTETHGSVARKLEDLIELQVNGTPLPPEAAAWATDRQTKRGKL